MITLEEQALRRQIDRLVISALDSCEGHLKTARAIVKGQLLADATLLNALLDDVIDAAVENCVGIRHRADNRRIIHGQAPSSRPPASERTQQATALLFNLVLGNGCKLSTAHRPELLAEAGFYDKQARAMTKKGCFFSLVAAALPNDDVTVDEILTEQQLHALFVQAQAAA